MARWWQWIPLLAGPLLVLAYLSWTEVSALVAVAATPTRQRLAVRLRVLHGLWRTGWNLRASAPWVGPSAHGATARPTRGGPPPVAAGPVLRHLLGPPWRVGLERLHARLRVGTGDPASTAVAFGAVHALTGAGLAVLGAWVRTEGRPRIDIRADDTRAVASLRAGCIVRTRLGHLIVALALGWWAARRSGAERPTDGGRRAPQGRGRTGGGGLGGAR